MKRLQVIQRVPPLLSTIALDFNIIVLFCLYILLYLCQAELEFRNFLES
jgi:hypothetical protein